MTEQTPSQRTRARGFLRGLGGGVAAVLITALLALIVVVAVIPAVMNGAALTVLSGSMEPTYSPGDIVVSVPQETYRVGDPVTFQPVSDDPTLITHRVVAVSGSGEDGRIFITRGDANGADDEPIVEDQVMGKVLYSIPKLGYLEQAVGGHRGLVVALLGVGLIAYAAYALVSAGLERRMRTTSAK